MDTFSLYFTLGWDHILDIRGYDHLLFIVTLCAIYFWSSWKHVLILVTAFTIGHSLTLALSALDIFRLPANVIETLIPLTILLTALYNVTTVGRTKEANPIISYALALFFGLIHGMGFSNYFRALLPGQEHIIAELFAFNVGIEVGQILIVCCFMGAYAILDKIFSIRARDWTLFWSGAGGGISVIMILDGLST